MSPTGHPPLSGRLGHLAVGCCALLAVVVIAWIFTSVTSWAARVFLSIVGLAPLLILRGLLRRERRAYAAASLCAIPYLVYGLTEAIADPTQRFWPAACLIVAFLWFIVVIAALRVLPALE